jgi:DNA-directed RNA polymerase specialized sigma24 family protein
VALAPTRPDARAAVAGARAVDAREALALVARLPVRTRSVLTLQVAGHSYAEIADALRMTHRTVERQLLRARAGVRSADRDAPAAPKRR